MTNTKIKKIVEIARKLNMDEFSNRRVSSGNTLDDALKELNAYLQKYVINKKRKRKITGHISKISSGDFSDTLPISRNEDELDVISMGLNIFVEELRDNSISIKAFDDVFNSFKSPFFIVNTNECTITKFNKSALKFFNYTTPNKYHVPISEILDKDLIKMLDSLNWDKSEGRTIQQSFKNNKGRWIVNFSKLDSTYNPSSSVAVLITDVTDEFEKEKEIKNIIVRTIVDTQEKERVRFAKDIHDSLGQQLSGISFYLASLVNKQAISVAMRNLLLSKSNDALKGVLEDVRNICFNLMPKTLEKHGLVESIYELCRKMKVAKILEFHINVSKNFPALDKSLEIAMFRIIQEFMNNAVKHGKAKRISIVLKSNLNHIQLSLKDNGIGFNFKKINNSQGMGLKNVKSRVESYNGNIRISSAVNRGTQYEITIPINKKKQLGRNH